MSSLLIKNATVVTLGKANQVIANGALLVEDGAIQALGPAPAVSGGADQVIDARGRVVMPGLICSHHHFYSTMARGMNPPGEPASNFVEILERLWWKVDRALQMEDVRLSALVPLCECIRNGTTTIVDHHASPSCRDGSLDVIAEATAQAGVRACLCYEVSDRNAEGAGVEENARFAARCGKEKRDDLKALFGLHASFTCSDKTVRRCVEAAAPHGIGFHIHVAEDKADVDHCLKQHGKRVVHRLAELGLAGPNSIFVHCVHIDDSEIDRLAETRTMVAHNPESNMNNAVGAAQVLKLIERGVLVGLGTDGMASDMLAQMRCAYLLHRHAAADPRVAFCEAPGMLLGGSAEVARRIFGLPLGELSAGGPADLIVLDYLPPTPLSADNLLGHLIFGMVDAAVDTTICRGRVLMRDKKILTLDEERIAAQCRERTPAMWERVRAL
ncbi:MAG: putative aminohydrolase SsnA [Deltaproteobacteria bacterium]|nr:putative aminohydrolase SsnA [Deltaproteobacteria bacterium]